MLLLAAGGTAVGTGLNAHPEFAVRVADELADAHRPAVRAPRRTSSPHWPPTTRWCAAHGALKTLAAALMKIANDVRWMASGPRSGLGEITIPENEPGSSIMPGKVNPTQCEAMTMLCCQVFGNDVADQHWRRFRQLRAECVQAADRPQLPAKRAPAGRRHALASMSTAPHGIEPNRDRIAELMERSLMLVTALAPHIGYDRAAQIAKQAQHEGLTLKQAALQLGYVTEEQFDAWIVPIDMTRPG